MDNVLRRQIREEVEAAFKERDDKKEPSNGEEKPTGKKTEQRLGSLLTKIRNYATKTTAKKTPTTKTKKLHVKYERFDPEFNEFKMVKTKEGGGSRFLEVICPQPISFDDIKWNAVNLFFNKDSRNFFMEEVVDCSFSLVTVTGEKLICQDLWEYLHHNGLTISKTVFILRSELEKSDHLPSALSFENPISPSNLFDDLLPESRINVSTTDSNGTKRKICHTCFRTYYEDECLSCQQNIEYMQSLMADNLNTPTTDGNSDNNNNEGDGADVDVAELRSRRLDHYGCHADTEPTKRLSVKRSMIRQDLINHFMGDKIEMKDKIHYVFINEKGKEEAGVGSGVCRDVYATFWGDVIESYFIGQDERVPFVRHDLYLPEWEAIGKILTKGYMDCGYFPLMISRCFIEYSLFQECTEEDLLSSFLNYISVDERQLVQEALATNDNSYFTTDELLEFLEQFKCRSLLSVNNVREVFVELARQEIIQKPYLMVSCWRKFLQQLHQYEHFSSHTNVGIYYESLKPTTKKVVALFQATPEDDSERDCLSYLKRYVRGLDPIQLKKLMRFLTGTDVMTIDKISIMFIKQSSFARRPIAHTCGPTLELSSTYANFCELREEFSCVLQKTTWEMDIV